MDINAPIRTELNQKLNVWSNDKRLSAFSAGSGHIIDRGYLQRKKAKEIQQTIHNSVLAEPKRRNYLEESLQKNRYKRGSRY